MIILLSCLILSRILVVDYKTGLKDVNHNYLSN